MLLETLDIIRNDVVIYSENKFDLKDNFKIIFKREPIKTPRSIDYFEVCKFVRDPVPKNVIVYRLLTNVSKLDGYSTKYGYFINTTNGLELIYFDPIFALKDILNLKIDIESAKFRFKIQQVGLSGINSQNDEAYFREMYSFDLRAIEAQNQNDRIFADAIFAFDDSYVPDITAEAQRRHPNDRSRGGIIEDQSGGNPMFTKAKIAGNKTGIRFNEENIDKLKKSFKSEWDENYKAYNDFQSTIYKEDSRGKTKTRRSFSDFLEEQQTSGDDKRDLLRSASEFQKGRNEPVILRFPDK